MISGFLVTQAVYVAARLGLADLLADRPRSVPDLARSLEVDCDALRRLLRVLAGVGVFESDDDELFRQTALSGWLRSDRPSLRNFALWAGGDWTWRPFGALSRVVETGRPAYPDVFDCPIDEYLARHSEAAQVFNDVMVERTQPVATALAAAYDFGAARQVVDVGGGLGCLLAEVLNAHRHLQGTLFELPAVAERARAWLADQRFGDRCRIVAGDFRRQFPVTGDVCILSSVVHDWDDTQARALLRRCRDALRPDGRLLLVEYVLRPDAGPDPAKFSDLIMLVSGTGRERTEDEFQDLLECSGFTFEGSRPLAAGQYLIEGRVP